MPTIVAHHDVKDTTHWHASPKREEFFGALGVTNIRTFTDPRNPGHVALIMDVPDLEELNAAMQTPAMAVVWRTSRARKVCCLMEGLRVEVEAIRKYIAI